MLRYRTTFSLIRFLIFTSLTIYLIVLVYNDSLENGFSFGLLMLALFPVLLAYIALIHVITIYEFYDDKIIIKSPFRLFKMDIEYKISEIQKIIYAHNIYSSDHLNFNFNNGAEKRHYFLKSLFNNNFKDLKSYLKEKNIPLYLYQRFKENTIIDD